MICRGICQSTQRDIVRRHKCGIHCRGRSVACRESVLHLAVGHFIRRPLDGRTRSANRGHGYTRNNGWCDVQGG